MRGERVERREERGERREENDIKLVVLNSIIYAQYNNASRGSHNSAKKLDIYPHLLTS